MKIEIPFVLKQGSLDDLSINAVVDNKSVHVEKSDGVLTIQLEANYGFHTLRLSLTSNHRIEFLDTRVDSASVRQFLYLSWAEQRTQKIQPCTELWEPELSWILPFMYPVSFLFDQAFDNIEQNLFGQDLFDKYEIFYPGSLILPETFPKVVRDFFEYNQSFTAIRRGSLRDLPVSKLGIDLDNVAIRNFAESSLDHYRTGKFRHLEKPIGQAKYNLQDDPLWDTSSWKSVSLAKFDAGSKTTSMLVTRSEWPEVYDFIEYYNIAGYDSMHLLYLKPGAFVAPHRDPATHPSSVNAHGLQQLYIPLKTKKGNFIKLGGVGIYDSYDSAYAINHVGYTHSVVNTSDELRVVMTIRCDIDKNKHLF